MRIDDIEKAHKLRKDLREMDREITIAEDHLRHGNNHGFQPELVLGLVSNRLEIRVLAKNYLEMLRNERSDKQKRLKELGVDLRGIDV